MKKVISNNINYVLANDASRMKFYGVMNISKQKGFITSRGYETHDYYCIALEGLTYANGWQTDCDKKHSLIGIINCLLNLGFEVFEFDNPKDLMKWLAED